MVILIAGLVLFLGVHSVRIFAPQWRDQKFSSMGEGTWKGAYSLVSLVGLVLLVWGYTLARPNAPVLYETPGWMAHLTIVLMAMAFMSLMVSQLPAGRLKPMLKHPMLLATKIWAFAHLLVNGDLASVLLFGSFLAWGVLDRISLKRRGAALAVAGPVTWDFAAVASGLVIWFLFIWQLHVWIAGVPIAI